MKGRKEAIGGLSAGSKSRTGSQTAAKSSAQQRSRSAAASHGGSKSPSSPKSTTGKGALHK